MKKVFGVGINDVKGITLSPCYTTWHSMLRRAYSDVYHSAKPVYADTSVDEEWHRLSRFKMWFDVHYKSGWQLDKDILKKDNRVYGPSTCCFVPPDINYLLIAQRSVSVLAKGVYYKQANRKYCSQLAASENGVRKTVYLGLFDTEADAFKAYKSAKESRIKQLAETYRSELEPHVYDALVNWQIEM